MACLATVLAVAAASEAFVAPSSINNLVTPAMVVTLDPAVVNHPMCACVANFVQQNSATCLVAAPGTPLFVNATTINNKYYQKHIIPGCAIVPLTESDVQGMLSCALGG